MHASCVGAFYIVAAVKAHFLSLDSKASQVRFGSLTVPSNFNVSTKKGMILSQSHKHASVPLFSAGSTRSFQPDGVLSSGIAQQWR